MKKIVASLFSTAVLAGAAFAAPAAADPASDASCAAHFVHGPAGPPGLFRSERRGDPLGVFGQLVSRVAKAEGESFAECEAAVP